jgi:hypothetical protein|tara:strand:- start:233 stop:439 length:207 start_codon:yes stop_codon:yes gene_type:complete
MFEYDDGLLADIVWRKYIEALEKIVRLEAQLVVAERTVTPLQEALNLQEVDKEDNHYHLADHLHKDDN